MLSTGTLGGAMTEAPYFTTTRPMACSCKDWRFRGHARPCKHIRALLDAEVLIAANERKWASREEGE